MEDHLLEEIVSEKSKKLDQVEVDKETKNWLLVNIDSSPYAIESCLIKEIIKDVQIFPLPFVPSYIPGLINRHGDPYTVIDLYQLFNQKKQETSLFLIVNDDEQTALQITDILEFRSTSVDSIRKFSDSTSAQFFSGIIVIDEKEIPIIDIQLINEQVRQDFGSN